MTKKRIIDLLRQLHGWLNYPEPDPNVISRYECRDALQLAILAVQKQPNFARLGKKGGESTKKKYGVAHLRRVGKLGGRPRKKRDETKRQ